MSYIRPRYPCTSNGCPQMVFRTNKVNHDACHLVNCPSCLLGPCETRCMYRCTYHTKKYDALYDHEWLHYAEQHKHEDTNIDLKYEMSKAISKMHHRTIIGSNEQASLKMRNEFQCGDIKNKDGQMVPIYATCQLWDILTTTHLNIKYSNLNVDIPSGFVLHSELRDLLAIKMGQINQPDLIDDVDIKVMIKNMNSYVKEKAANPDKAFEVKYLQSMYLSLFKYIGKILNWQVTQYATCNADKQPTRYIDMGFMVNSEPDIEIAIGDSLFGSVEVKSCFLKNYSVSKTEELH